MSRASIVGVLIAVEVLIAGIALYVIGNAGGWSAMHGRAFGSMGHYSFAALPVAPLDAGTTPTISIEDPDSRVELGVSSDGRVHVTDLTNVRGARMWGDSSIPQLHVTRTSDGVSIVRVPHVHFFVFGPVDERIEVEVPAGSTVNIARCSGADVTGITGAVTVRSQDGHITLADLHGAVDARDDDGYIEANGIHTATLTMTSADGHLGLRDVTAETLTARTNDGRIQADDVTVAGARPNATFHSDDGSVRVSGSFAPGGTYAVSSNDGRVTLGVPNTSNLTIDASTGDGSIVVDGDSVSGSQHTIRLGDGSGNLSVSTSDGSIHISTNNGAV